MVRKIYENELKDLLELYLHLHESTISEMSEYLSKHGIVYFRQQDTQ